MGNSEQVICAIKDTLIEMGVSGNVDSNAELLFKKINKLFCGNRVYFKKTDYAARNASIIKDYKRGEGVIRLAVKYSLSPNRIRVIVRE
jgi:Mor family transcriptional regulator